MANPATAARVLSFRFDLLDQFDNPIGTLHPSADQTPVIQCDTARAVMRTLTGLRLMPADVAAVNPERDRIRPVLVQAGGAETRLGVFAFTDKSRAVTSYGKVMDASLGDRGVLLSQGTDRAYGYPAGADIRAAIVQVVLDAGVSQVVVDNAASGLEAPIAWPAGTNRQNILSQLADLGGLRAPWFDGDGVGRAQRIVDPNAAPPPPAALVYEAGDFYRQSPVETDDLLTAPNRFVVIGSGNTPTPAVGVWDVPGDAPHSYANRQVRITETIRPQGVASASEAARVARQTGQRRAVYEQVTFTGPLNPQHQAFDVVQFLGEVWLETGWTMPLKAGAAMSHSLVKVYS